MMCFFSRFCRTRQPTDSLVDDASHYDVSAAGLGIEDIEDTDTFDEALQCPLEIWSETASTSSERSASLSAGSLSTTLTDPEILWDRAIIGEAEWSSDVSRRSDSLSSIRAVYSPSRASASGSTSSESLSAFSASTDGRDDPSSSNTSEDSECFAAPDDRLTGDWLGLKISVAELAKTRRSGLPTRPLTPYQRTQHGRLTVLATEYWQRRLHGQVNEDDSSPFQGTQTSPIPQAVEDTIHLRPGPQRSPQLEHPSALRPTAAVCENPNEENDDVDPLDRQTDNSNVAE